MQNREEQEVKNKVNTNTYMLLNEREVPKVGFTGLKKVIQFDEAQSKQ